MLLNRSWKPKHEPTLGIEDDSDTEEEEDEGNEHHDEEEWQPAVKTSFAPTRLVRYYLYTCWFPANVTIL